jgi:hypothetical protein
MKLSRSRFRSISGGAAWKTSIYLISARVYGLARCFLRNVYDGLPVLVTGHTGFKGSWLALWLKRAGADVTGFSLPEMPTAPSNYRSLPAGDRLTDVRGDVRDLEACAQSS